jgi:hypothetical protein
LIGELFQKDVRTINELIQNVFAEGELQREATIRKFRIVQLEGARSVEREVHFYNLDVIISVGYRVKSHRGTQFRQWATARLKEYLVKGFTMDDERLKNPPGKGHTDYFDELLARIRDIRSSDRRLWLARISRGNLECVRQGFINGQAPSFDGHARAHGVEFGKHRIVRIFLGKGLGQPCKFVGWNASLPGNRFVIKVAHNHL